MCVSESGMTYAKIGLLTVILLLLMMSTSSSYSEKTRRPRRSLSSLAKSLCPAAGSPLTCLVLLSAALPFRYRVNVVDLYDRVTGRDAPLRAAELEAARAEARAARGALRRARERVRMRAARVELERRLAELKLRKKGKEVLEEQEEKT